jgi:hypothetical protein
MHAEIRLTPAGVLHGHVLIPTRTVLILGLIYAVVRLFGLLLGGEDPVLTVTTRNGQPVNAGLDSVASGDDGGGQAVPNLF